MLCDLILYINGGDLQFKVDSERQILLETFHGNFYLLSEFLLEICWGEVAKEILFVFYFDVWSGARTLAFELAIELSNIIDFAPVLPYFRKS